MEKLRAINSKSRNIEKDVDHFVKEEISTELSIYVTKTGKKWNICINLVLFLTMYMRIYLFFYNSVSLYILFLLNKYIKNNIFKNWMYFILFF